MTTINLTDRYDVTLAGPTKVRKGFEVTGRIWNRQTHKQTDIAVEGKGRTISAAQDRAIKQAKERCPDDSDG
jgi:hypothetical protein